MTSHLYKKPNKIICMT